MAGGNEAALPVCVPVLGGGDPIEGQQRGQEGMRLAAMRPSSAWMGGGHPGGQPEAAAGEHGGDLPDPLEAATR